MIKNELDSKISTTYKYISYMAQSKSKPSKRDWKSEGDQENRPYGVVGINDGLVKYPVLAVEDNLQNPYVCGSISSS